MRLLRSYGTALLTLALLVHSADAQTPVLLKADSNQAPLPALNTKDSLSGTIAKFEKTLGLRLEKLEKDLVAVHGDLKSNDIDTRISALEKALHAYEERDQIERSRLLVDLRARYANGHTLYGAMDTRLQTLSAHLESVDAFIAVVQLADLRQYPGFEAAFNRLKGELGTPERSWLDKLLGSAVTKLTANSSIGALHPALGVASFALTQLQNILPVLAREKFKGNEFVTTFENLSCGLKAVNAIHDDLGATAVLNTKLKSRVDSLAGTYATKVATHRAKVGAGPQLSEADFHRRTEAYFEALNKASASDLGQAVDSMNVQLSVFQTNAREYAAVIDEHLAYWRQLREQMEARRNVSCVRNTPDLFKNYGAAIAKIDVVLAKTKRTYLFEAGDKPENQYFRVVTKHAED